MSEKISLHSTPVYIRPMYAYSRRHPDEETASTMDREYLLCLARAFTSFNGLYPRTEDDFCAAAKALHVDARLVYACDRVFCNFQDHKSLRSETYAISGHGILELSNLGECATAQLEDLMYSKKIYGSPAARLILAFSLSALICPLMFGGSFLDMLAAGVGAVIISSAQFVAIPRNFIFGKIAEVTVTILMSFFTRALSSMTDNLFCYPAISSAALVGVLPVYLLQQGSFKTISTRGTFSTGVSHTFTALWCTLSLALAAKLGSSLYLLSIGSSISDRANIVSHYTANLGIRSSFATDAMTLEPGFSVNANLFSQHIKSYISGVTAEDCLCSPTDSWYLQPFSPAARYMLVPFFAVIFSMSHSQRLLSVQTPIMAMISCIAYTIHDVIHSVITLPELAPAALQSCLAALLLGLLYTIVITRAEHLGITYNVSIPGIIILVLLGTFDSGEITSGIGLHFVLNMFLVAHSVTLGVFVGEALVSTSNDENYLIDALEEAQQELNLHDAFIKGIL